MKFDIWGFFGKLSRNSSFIKIGQEKRALYMKLNIHFWSYLSHFFLEWENFQKKSCRVNKTHILSSATFFFENLAVYEIMWKNIVQRDRPHMKIRRMGIAGWITKATNTHSEYVTLIAFPSQQCLQESASVLRTLRVFSQLHCVLPLTWKTLPISSNHKPPHLPRKASETGCGWTRLRWVESYSGVLILKP